VVGDIPSFNRLLYQLGYLLYFLGRSFYWFDISATLGQFSNSSFSTSSGSPNPLRVLPGWSYWPHFFPFLLLSRLLFELVFSWRTELFWEERFSAYQSIGQLFCFCCSGMTLFPQADVAESQFVAVLQQPVSISSTIRHPLQDGSDSQWLSRQ